MTGTSVLHRIFQAALLSSTGYVVTDVFDEAFLYLHSRRIGMEAVRKNEELMEMLGDHVVAGQWFNASVSKQHYGHMTSCSFPVIGDKFGTEVVVKLIRNNGAPSSFIHNTIGTGKWFIMDCHAVLPGKGGLPKILRLTDTNDSYRKSVSYFTFASLFQSIQLD